MYAATGGPNVEWVGTDFKWGGRAPLAPPLATALRPRINESAGDASCALFGYLRFVSGGTSPVMCCAGVRCGGSE